MDEHGVDSAEPAVQVHCPQALLITVTKPLTEAAGRREGLRWLVVSEGFQSKYLMVVCGSGSGGQ